MKKESKDSSVPSQEQTFRYWQWIYSKPTNSNPLRTGEVNQDDFIMLPCTGGGEDCNRVFNLSPQDTSKNILIPVFCCEYSTGEVSLDSSPDELLDLARKDSSSPTEMECSIDDIQLEPHYVESKPFEIRVPPDHLLDNKDAPPGIYTAVSVGYWHLLGPLPSGSHRLRFGGSNKDGFHTKVEYTLNVPKS